MRLQSASCRCARPLSKTTNAPIASSLIAPALNAVCSRTTRGHSSSSQQRTSTVRPASTLAAREKAVSRRLPSVSAAERLSGARSRSRPERRTKAVKTRSSAAKYASSAPKSASAEIPPRDSSERRAFRAKPAHASRKPAAIGRRRVVGGSPTFFSRELLQLRAGVSALRYRPLPVGALPIAKRICSARRKAL